MKGKLQVVYENIEGKINECNHNIMTAEKMKLKKRVKKIKAAQIKLENLQEALSSLQKYSLPSLSAVERALFLKDNSITQLINTLKVTSYRSAYELLDISQWKTDMDDWLQSLTKILLCLK